MSIDLNRGVIQRTHPDGFFVCMYFDDPATFLDADGSPLPEELAAQAGYDVRALKLERKRAELMAKKRAEVEEELARLEEMPVEPVKQDRPMVEGVGVALRREKGLRSMKHRGGGQWDVYHAHKMLAKKLTKEDAYRLVAEAEE